MTDQTCAAAILELLTLYPDCEMRAKDVFAELDEKWPQAEIDGVLEELVQQRAVTRLNDGGTAWHSVAIQRLDASKWREDGE